MALLVTFTCTLTPSAMSLISYTAFPSLACSSSRAFLSLPSKSSLIPGLRFNHPPTHPGLLKGHLEALPSHITHHTVDCSLHFNYAAHDTLCSLAVFAGSYAWIRLFDILVQKNLLEQKLSRKLVHISTGILYALVWPMFSVSPSSRFFAVVIPLANVLKLLVYGLGILKDEGLVKSISRGGTSMELLRGPLYYVLVLSLCTLFFWRDSPVGIVALAMMCGGDGIADIVGRRIGGTKLPYNPCKSWAGSISMFIFGFMLSVGFLYYYSSLGFYHLDWGHVVQNVALISFAATIVESLPISKRLDDNLSVPLVSVLLGVALFPAATL